MKTVSRFDDYELSQVYKPLTAQQKSDFATVGKISGKSQINNKID